MGKNYFIIKKFWVNLIIILLHYKSWFIQKYKKCKKNINIKNNSYDLTYYYKWILLNIIWILTYYYNEIYQNQIIFINIYTLTTHITINYMI